MSITILLGVFSTILLLIHSKRANLKIVFFYVAFLVFLFLGLRYDFGTDFPAYASKFDFIANSSWDVLLYSSHDFFDDMEKGWFFLQVIFSPFHFNVLLAFIAIVWLYVYKKHLFDHIKPEYKWYGFFIFFFNINTLLVPSSAMRQGIASVIFVYSLHYLYQRRWLPYLLAIFVASSFHRSAMMLYPFVLLCFLQDLSLNRKLKFFIFSLFASFYVLKPFYQSLISEIIGLIFGARYGSYFNLFETSEQSVINTIIYIAVLALILRYYDNFDRMEKVLSLLAISGLFFFPIDAYVPLAGRMAMFFEPINIVLYPLLMSQFKHVNNRRIFIIVIVAIIAIRFFRFYNSDSYLHAFDNYHIIFSK